MYERPNLNISLLQATTAAAVHLLRGKPAENGNLVKSAGQGEITGFPEGGDSVGRVSSRYLLNPVKKPFVAGTISTRLASWQQITRDQWVLDMVKGVKIPLEEWPQQERVPFPYRLKPEEQKGLDSALRELEAQNVIQEVSHVEGEFISNVFPRWKSNGKARVILNLNKMNEYTEYQHFKMNSLQTAIDLMRPGMYFGTVDLEQAYFSFNVHEDFRILQRFNWHTRLMEFTCLTNGLGPAPRIFTKVLNPAFGDARDKGVECVQFIDDTLVGADTPEKCAWGLDYLITKFLDLGFYISWLKSLLTPSQEAVFLGFILNSILMTVRVTADKVENFKKKAQIVLAPGKVKIRDIARLVGTMVAYSPGLEYAWLHIRHLERDRNVGLSLAAGDYEGYTYVRKESVEDINWWLTKLPTQTRKIRLEIPTLVIHADASGKHGWGATFQGRNAGARWSFEESQYDINVKELLAVKYALLAFIDGSFLYILIYSDNTTAITYLKKMGGTSIHCDEVAREIWQRCEEKGIYLLPVHIPGKLNVQADYNSRVFDDEKEWELNPVLFERICKIFGVPEIDLFASMLNHKVDKYVSYQPDPYAWKVDAFSINWSQHYCYLFPPSNQVLRALTKIQNEKVKSLLVVPEWKHQPWFGTLRAMHQQHKRRIAFRPSNNNLIPHGEPNNKEKISRLGLKVYRFF